MSKSSYAVIVLFVLALLPQSWAVSNAVVGTCHKGTQYTTIQAAIDAADVGSTVQVCPGTYYEVLTITKNLNLKGIPSTNSTGTYDNVVIAVPSTGVPVNASSGIWGNLAVQVLVQNATANLSNLTINGGGVSTCPQKVTPVGVLFQVAGGSMTNSMFQDPTGCTQISAFLDLTTNFNFSDNYLRDCQDACLEIDYGTNTIAKGNDITSVKGFGVGIDIQQLGGPATISANVIHGYIGYGISAQKSPSVTVAGNNVMFNQEGSAIALFATTKAIVESNRVSAYVGIFLDDNGAVGGNTVSHNTVAGGTCGVQIHTTNQGDTIAGNLYFNEPQFECTF